ncbi:hypothetical protein [uncultured Oscillibacter sp.]|uniref:hypothetical protein n=1 Tax=uncultured Oscillibacter sp. TaxID=876091 RepID=UPI0025CC58F7|nr:hypothetical protein [uncultured Oscillibacter sp.]
MDGIWTTLGLEPARDVSAIKRAHAGRTKTCRPEGFAAAERLFIISVQDDQFRNRIVIQVYQ